MKNSLKRRCSMRRRWPSIWLSLTWICEAWEKLASCLCVDCVAMMPGRFGAEIAEAHGEAAGIERMELHEARPGLVEQDVVAEVADLLDDHAGVVDRAVVGALLDHGDAERPLAPPRFLVGDQRVIADLLADARFVERLVEDRADQPVRVAVGLEEDRDAAAEEQRAVMRRLVVVAVEQHEVAFGDQRRAARSCWTTRCRSARSRSSRRRRSRPPPSAPSAPGLRGPAGRRARARSCRDRRGRPPRRDARRRCGRSGCGCRRRRRCGRGRSRAGCRRSA